MGSCSSLSITITIGINHQRDQESANMPSGGNRYYERSKKPGSKPKVKQGNPVDHQHSSQATSSRQPTGAKVTSSAPHVTSYSTSSTYVYPQTSYAKYQQPPQSVNNCQPRPQYQPAPPKQSSTYYPVQSSSRGAAKVHRPSAQTQYVPEPAPVAKEKEKQVYDLNSITNVNGT